MAPLALAGAAAPRSPARRGKTLIAIAPVVAGMALFVAACVWLAAIVGIVTVSFRSIGT